MAPSPEPHPFTLFHLLPINRLAREALDHPNNRSFVSAPAHGLVGLEVGFHIPTRSSGPVITSVGQNADLILRHSSPLDPMSQVHAAFEFNIASHHVVLSTCSDWAESVLLQRLNSENALLLALPDSSWENLELSVYGNHGGGALTYGQSYFLNFAAYRFVLYWMPGSLEHLKDLAIRSYLSSQWQAHFVPTALLPMGGTPRLPSTEFTGPESDEYTALADIPYVHTQIGLGTFGSVYSAIDVRTGNAFAIKVIRLGRVPDKDAVVASLRKEVQIMERLYHPNIIEHLGHRNLDTLQPEIFMPLRDGTLRSLVEDTTRLHNHYDLCLNVLRDMLCALDYISCRGLIHRDVKPENILYYRMANGTSYCFQLADFGLAQHGRKAWSPCGTLFYQAPELWPTVSAVDAQQSPKMDIWSLFATMIGIQCHFYDFPPKSDKYDDVLDLLKAKAAEGGMLEPMGRADPIRRASAAQMLLEFFDGQGLTTKASKISPMILKSTSTRTHTATMSGESSSTSFAPVPALALTLASTPAYAPTAMSTSAPASQDENAFDFGTEVQH